MLDFTILVLEGAYPTSVAVTLDVLAAAATLAPRLGVAPPRWKLYSIDGAMTPLQLGVCVSTTRLPSPLQTDQSVWIVPGLGLDEAAAIQQRLALDDAHRAVDALQKHAHAGGQIAASCSAVFLLQAAGLLAGRRVTTSWWLAPALKRIEPGCVVDADRMVCADGPLVTAGAAFAQTDLMLHLLRTRCGNALADAVSRVLLIDGRQAQAPFIVPEVFANGDDLVARLAARIETSLPEPPSVGELAREFCMSEKTLSRHIQRATGKSTLALVQSVKLRRARALLESSRMTVEQIAAAVGYQDATALRRMMKRVAGANPSRFRPTIAALP
ncbi:helix-turn-helix domain-containing protein [Pseudomonas gingeri]|uniref:GlxA family transcriptional regulator n=1 Tax=Pseudomonas gingeri TaxID=117681 RepID=UPI0015A1612C|nr:helix-turn-helix domain-containing protein [Pseudomonas gingeri]NWA25577.1 helix-turn-helix domain-containing protein [Pseudomonas gingeri]